jgi:hypothetical protein
MGTTKNNTIIIEFMGGLWSEPAQKYGIGRAEYFIQNKRSYNSVG